MFTIGHHNHCLINTITRSKSNIKMPPTKVLFLIIYTDIQTRTPNCESKNT